MKLHSLVAALACVALASGCTYSNDDLVFLSALPAKDDLSAKLPQDGTAGTASQGLAVGEPSELFGNTKKASESFNSGVLAMLSIIDYVRSLPPTEREKNLRIWGPFDDEKNKGFESRMVMEREAAKFTYRIEQRKKGQADWTGVLTGEYLSSGGVRTGKGKLVLEVGTARALGTAGADLQNLESLKVDYATDSDPISVDLVFVPIAEANAEDVTYSYRDGDKGGSIRFKATGNLTGAAAVLETFEITTRWLKDGRGRGELTIVKGDGAGASRTDCWDAAGNTTYAKANWPFGPSIGAESSCPDVSGL